MKTIALTCSTEKEKYFLASRYAEYVLDAAKYANIPVMPVILPLTKDKNVIDEYSRSFDGYLFTGGDDVDPIHYGEEKHEKCGVTEGERDVFELSLLKHLIALDRPVFGICRGIQIMNVALGGSLWQDHYSQVEREGVHVLKNSEGKPRHKVKISGYLHDIIGSDEIVTNSYHHQAVKKAGNGIIVCARSEDGIVEGIYHEKLSYYRAVQWHPEIDSDETSMKIIADFLHAI